jgi:hypothetical protein
MTAVATVLIVVVATVSAAMWLGRRWRVDLSPLGWDLADAARRQIPLLSGQAAVAITALVLLVTLVRDRSGVVAESFDTVLVMFLVAFVSFIGVGTQLVYLPNEEGRDGVLQSRTLFDLAAIEHYRTLFLGWMALKPLVDSFGLYRTGSVLVWLLAVAALAGWLIVASACYRSRLISAWEALLLPAAGILLAHTLTFALQEVMPTSGYQNALALTLALFVLNGTTFAVQALVPILHGRFHGARWIEMAARGYLLADLQASVVTLTLLWGALRQPL